MATEVPSKLLAPRWGCRQTERRAWTTLQRCLTEAGLAELPAPIPVEDWIEGPLGIQLGFTDLSHLGDRTLGAAFVDEWEIQVDEKVLQHEGRCRFTCAHELGHLMMHGRKRQQFQDSHADVSFSHDKMERQADRFAAAFLMPLPLLERDIVAAFDERRLKRAECVNELMHVTAESEWLWRYRVLPAITKRFEVSLSAAIFRCTELEPRVRNPRPLLPRQLINRLLYKARNDDTVSAVQVIGGRPQYRDLFTKSGDMSATT